MATAAAVGSLALGAVGTGVSVYGLREQRRTSESLANYNYRVAEANASYQSRLVAYQTQVQRRQLEYEAAIHAANAKVLESQAIAAESAGTERLRRTAREGERLRGTQTARYAAAGVAIEGTPMDVIAESAGDLQITLNDVKYAAEMDARGFRHQAGEELTRQRLSLLSSEFTKFRGELAQEGIRQGLAGARIAQLSGLDRSRGYGLAAVGTLLSGGAQFAGNAYRFIDSGAFSSR